MSDQAQDRRAALDARFKANEEARQVQKEERRAAAAELNDPAENAARFWQEFNASADGVQADMRECMARSKSMGDAEKRDAFPAKVAEWNSSLEALQKASTDAAVFLAKYDVRQAESRVGMVRELLEEARAQLVPRKKFAFRRRGKASGTSAAAQAPAEEKAEANAPAGDSCSKFDVPEKSFEHRTGETLVVRPGELCGADASESVDFRLTHLEDCVVFLFDITRALHIDNLKGCTVFTGPIAGSVLMEGCTDCTFVFASRQIRLHTSHRCDFYLHVLSRPIIEHCDTLRFAPYGLNYPQWPAQLRAAELDKPRAKTMWQNVDDFGWHRAQHSPNWSQLPYGEYLLAWPASASAVAAELRGALANPLPKPAPLATAPVDPTPEASAVPAAAATGDDDDDDDDDEL